MASNHDKILVGTDVARRLRHVKRMVALLQDAGRDLAAELQDDDKTELMLPEIAACAASTMAALDSWTSAFSARLATLSERSDNYVRSLAVADAALENAD